jgi:RNA polymerase sigma factor (sigma-70 family)
LKTEYEKAVACEMFDAYCKQILRNALADYLRKKNFLNEHEIPTADMDLYIDTGNEIPERSWESVLNIEFEGQSYPLENESLHKALSTLSERYIGVLLLKYWHRMNDSEIASHFGIAERTVRYWRKSAIEEIKSWYLVNHVKLDYPSSQD